jgi:Predicted periplasmic ligand-binding sensor domain
MRLSTKLVLSFAGIICVILAMSGSSIFSTLKMNDSFKDVENSYFPALGSVDDMHRNFWAVRSNLSAMLLARETSAAAAYDAKITESLRNIAEQRKNYLSSIGVFSAQDRAKATGLLDEVDKLSSQMGLVRKQITALVGQGQFDAAYAQFDTGYRPLFRKLAPAYAALADMRRSFLWSCG